MTRRTFERGIPPTSLPPRLIGGGVKVGSSNHDSSNASARGANSRRSSRAEVAPETQTGATEILGAPDGPINLQQTGAKSARLVADREYFGLEAEVLRAGAERTLARFSRQSPETARIDVRTLSDDFLLDAASGAVLLSALLSGGMLHPDGAGAYLPTRQFRQCALACVVAPMSRDRAKSLIDRACVLAAEINSEWTRSPFRIKTVVVSGSYMSRRKELSELSLSLGLSRRQEARTATLQTRDDGVRKIVDAMQMLSSFISVRIVSERHAVPRPFSVVFQADNVVAEAPTPSWGRFVDWGASLTRKLASR